VDSSVQVQLLKDHIYILIIDSINMHGKDKG
jgi:hypothetical protein